MLDPHNRRFARQYVRYIDAVGDGQAGRLQTRAGETLTAIRRRLGAAARLSGKDLTIRRVDGEIYFWVRGSNHERRRDGY